MNKKCSLFRISRGINCICSVAICNSLLLRQPFFTNHTEVFFCCKPEDSISVSLTLQLSIQRRVCMGYGSFPDPEFSVLISQNDLRSNRKLNH